MEIYVGTSGWSYAWNRGRSLAWYVEELRLNAVELNGSFYRFPRREHVEGWARDGSSLRWAVKVHRLVTHRHQFGDGALEAWERFRSIFEPLDDRVDFYLFQAPPRFADTERLAEFARAVDLGDRCALEIRNPEILRNDARMRALQRHAVAVSVDSPHVHNRIFPGPLVYLRMHGRGAWYAYDYPAEELRETAERIRAARPERAYVFFNNDHSMPANARAMLEILRGAG